MKLHLSDAGCFDDTTTSTSHLPRRPKLTRVTKYLSTANHTQAEPHLEGVAEVLGELTPKHSISFINPMRATNLLFLMQVLAENPFAKYEVTIGSGSVEDPTRHVVLSKNKSAIYYRALLKDQNHSSPNKKYRFYYVVGTSPMEIWGSYYDDNNGANDDAIQFTDVCFKRIGLLDRGYHLPGPLKRYVPGMVQSK